MARVVISSGHTSDNPGVVANGLREYDVARKIARYTLKYVRQCGIISLSTPPNMDLAQRIQWINSTGYTAESNDIAIEIHINDGGKSGIEGWYYGDGQNASQDMTNKVVDSLITQINLPNIGVKSEFQHEMGSISFIHEVYPISCVIECGFIDNPTDAALLKDEVSLDKMGQGIAKGILKYFNVDVEIVPIPVQNFQPQIQPQAQPQTQPQVQVQPQVQSQFQTQPTYQTQAQTMIQPQEMTQPANVQPNYNNNQAYVYNPPIPIINPIASNTQTGMNINNNLNPGLMNNPMGSSTNPYQNTGPFFNNNNSTNSNYGASDNSFFNTGYANPQTSPNNSPVNNFSNTGSGTGTTSNFGTNNGLNNLANPGFQQNPAQTVNVAKTNFGNSGYNNNYPSNQIPSAGQGNYSNYNTPAAPVSKRSASTKAPFLTRDERKTMIVNNYVKILGREPNENDLNYFLNIGIREDDLVKKMMDSQEHADLVKARQEILGIRTKMDEEQNELMELRTNKEEDTIIIEGLNQSIIQKNAALNDQAQRIRELEQSKNAQSTKGKSSPVPPGKKYKDNFPNRVFKAFSDILE